MAHEVSLAAQDLADFKKKRVPQLSSYVFDQTILSLFRHARDGTPRTPIACTLHMHA